MYHLGYRESSFAYSILSAGVAHAVTRACSQGIITSCGCGSIDMPKNRMTPNVFISGSGSNESSLIDDKRAYKTKNKYRWKWGGCSHNIIFGIEFSRIFLDAKEKAGDIKSIINLHNNHAGRMVTKTPIPIHLLSYIAFYYKLIGTRTTDAT